MMRISSVLLLAMLAPAAFADTVPAPPNAIDLPPYTAVPPCDELPGRATVGTITAQTGTVTRAAPGCAPEPLACDAALLDGDRVETEADARVAVRAGGAWVQLAGDSAALLRRESDGSLSLVVERGNARVMRLGEGPVPRVETRELAALEPGDDVAAQVGDRASSVCSWSGPLDVRIRASGRITRATAGDCVLPDEAAASASFVVSIADVARCEVAVGELEPFDVAGGPPLPPPSFPPPPFPPPLCVSGACGGGGGAIPVVEQPGGYEPPP